MEYNLVSVEYIFLSQTENKKALLLPALLLKIYFLLSLVYQNRQSTEANKPTHIGLYFFPTRLLLGIILLFGLLSLLLPGPASVRSTVSIRDIYDRLSVQHASFRVRSLAVCNIATKYAWRYRIASFIAQGILKYGVELNTLCWFKVSTCITFLKIRLK